MIILDCSGGPSVIPRVPGSERGRQKGQSQRDLVRELNPQVWPGRRRKETELKDCRQLLETEEDMDHPLQPSDVHTLADILMFTY